MSKSIFSQKVKSYLKTAGYSQKILARELVMNPSVLTHKLNGTGRTILTHSEIKQIVKTLAKLEAINSRSAVLELLKDAECPSFTDEEWNNFPLNKLKLDQNKLNEMNKEASPNHRLMKENSSPLASDEVFISPNNLPKALTSFLGRQREIEEVITLLTGPNSSRLVTLTGIGGTGKTRLALEIAEKLTHNSQFEYGIFFIALETVTTEQELINELAVILDIKNLPGKTQVDTLKSFLTEKSCLLVLDNFEQLVEAASLLVNVLKSTINLKFLVTSRIPLWVSLEQTYPVEPLPLPTNKILEIPTLEENAAVALFTVRTKTITPGFTLIVENKASVVGICRKLEGLPLAIELASGRMRAFTTQQLLERLDLKLLTGGARDLPTRQKTLKATIEWSYDLLTAKEQVLFTRLSIFAGGFTLESADVICNPGNKLSQDLFEEVDSLLSKNLLLRKESSGEVMRFGMLQTIMEYGQEKLIERGEYDQINENYLNYYVDMAEKIGIGIDGKEQLNLLKLIDGELDNFRTCLAYILNQLKVNGENAELLEKALKIVDALGNYWNARGYMSEGRRSLEEILALAELDANLSTSSNMAKALNTLGSIYIRQGELKLASKYFEKSLVAGRENKNLFFIASTLLAMSGIWENLGNYNKARRYAEESLQIYQEIGDKQGIARATYGVGWMYFWPGDNETGRPYFEESLKLARELGDNYLIIFSMNSLALIKTYADGDTKTAYQNSQKALALSKEVGMTLEIAYSLMSLGMIALAAGEYDISRQHLEECVTLCLQTGDKREIFGLKLYLGEVAYAKGEYARAFEDFKESLAICREMNAISYLVFPLTGLVGIGNFLFEQSTNSDKSKILLYCARMGGIISMFLTSVGLKLRQPELGYYEKAVKIAQHNLGVETFKAAFKEGLDFGLEEALDYATTIQQDSAVLKDYV